MSNIHTLAEYRDDYGENLPFNRKYYQSQSSFIQRSKPIDVVNLIFPHFTWKSFIMAVSIIQIIVFIISVSIKPADFLTPSDSLLITLGANVASRIKQGEIHRLILPIFLHANIFHTFFNVFFQLRMGFTLEKNYGIVKVIILYFLTGIYGNILSSSVTYCPIKVGASTSGMGLLGVVTSELILLWHVIRHRERVVFNIIFFSLISFFYYFTFNGSNIDHVGHLGGLLSGISMGILYNSQMENKPSWYDHMKMASYACLALLAIVPPIVLFAVPRTC
ncbi:rhomboid protease ROM1, putative [Plasmodium vivax]|uniref:Rhomboid-like protease n=6 Tax=Plasmodium vivax TaxID=5855 RepID=A5K4F6_PLAVS|nr:rhomboid-like protease 1, putative [Plasmodium vivax]KMZ80593.1 rhomboid-like protease 1 [Plasmodium vivax India VII]KMZ84101.1 rhomboid-like protease 1 [Plasmodium vivax Brazil I]KMZ93185.1 rhomboid-like protease 1 [Plasmodium vivax Mauritania I]KMZ99677.1 rhomboid-like protease 1 [Plasmodium vivax North Korean]AQZ21804.1 rhomboid-like protease 1 [Plasmodium vivax]|eukprot:XP_001615261.1 rhomboid-like protease 1 [Plasmodium vivax Sal-1]